MKCDHVFIVAEIKRAITDQSLKSSLYNVLARHVPLEWERSGLKVSVVCTKTDVNAFQLPLCRSALLIPIQDINKNAARREFCGPNKKISQLKIEELEKAIQRAREEDNRTLEKLWKQKRVENIPKVDYAN
jgi:hypothetical protein